MATSTLSSSAEKTRTSPREQSREPNQSLRTALTLLILFHLFSLFVAVAANPPTSELLFRLKRTPIVREYLEVLGMDLSYRFHLTYGAAEDRGWQVQAELTMPDDSQQTILFPDPEMSEVRQQHFHQLLLRWATTPDEGLQGTFAQTVARRLIEESGAKSAVVRLRARVLLSPEEVQQGVDPHAETRFVTVYEGRAWYNSNGESQFMKTAGGAESAPASGSTEPPQ